ncbi:MAG: hypothetical protein M3N93_08710 [Acidobacteriota bacterium]|nr:hypothetical protein [Acidobacteriota bacterium]
MRRSVRSVIYETDPGDDGAPAVLRIRELDPEEGIRQAERWKEAMKFSHPNLLRVYGAGQCVLNGTPIAWVKMERADESLAGVLAERALSEEETSEMLGPTLSALAYLHKNGYAHGSLKPSNVMAAGDKLKLSTDSAALLDEVETVAEDVRALGALIVEALTQRRPSGPEQWAGKLSPMFSDIAMHSLDPDPRQRWTVQEIEKRLYAPSQRVEANDKAKAEASEPSLQRHGTSVSHGDTVAAGAPSGGVPQWVYAALAVVLLIVAYLAVSGKFSGASRNGSTSGAGSGLVAAAPALTEPPGAKEVAPLPARLPAAPVETAPRTPAPRAAGRKANGWAVIVAAYGSREAAAKRMNSMARKWPAFKVAILEPGGEKARFIVVLGHDLSEPEAEALRKRAIGAGLPRDAYIKKFM